MTTLPTIDRNLSKLLQDSFVLRAPERLLEALNFANAVLAPCPETCSFSLGRAVGPSPWEQLRTPGQERKAASKTGLSV